MITKQDILAVYKPEISRTIKVMRAVPEGKLDFTLHENSNSIRALFQTFIVEAIINMSVIRGEVPQNFMEAIPDFDTVAEGIEKFEEANNSFISALESTPEADIEQSFLMWGTDGTRGTHLFGVMADMIHHRGQLSAYLRPAGGKVPAIYGPSGDEGISL